MHRLSYYQRKVREMERRLRKFPEEMHHLAKGGLGKAVFFGELEIVLESYNDLSPEYQAVADFRKKKEMKFKVKESKSIPAAERTRFPLSAEYKNLLSSIVSGNHEQPYKLSQSGATPRSVRLVGISISVKIRDVETGETTLFPLNKLVKGGVCLEQQSTAGTVAFPSH